MNHSQDQHTGKGCKGCDICCSLWFHKPQIKKEKKEKTEDKRYKKYNWKKREFQWSLKEENEISSKDG